MVVINTQTHMVADEFWHHITCFAFSKEEAIEYVKQNYKGNGKIEYRGTTARPSNRWGTGVYEFSIM